MISSTGLQFGGFKHVRQDRRPPRESSRTSAVVEHVIGRDAKTQPTRPVSPDHSGRCSDITRPRLLPAGVLINARISSRIRCSTMLTSHGGASRVTRSWASARRRPRQAPSASGGSLHQPFEVLGASNVVNSPRHRNPLADTDTTGDSRLGAGRTGGNVDRGGAEVEEPEQRDAAGRRGGCEVAGGGTAARLAEADARPKPAPAQRHALRLRRSRDGSRRVTSVRDRSPKDCCDQAWERRPRKTRGEEMEGIEADDGTRASPIPAGFDQHLIEYGDLQSNANDLLVSRAPNTSETREDCSVLVQSNPAELAVEGFDLEDQARHFGP